MKKMKISRTILLVVTVLFMACDAPTWIIADLPPETPSEIPPFVITKPVMEIVERPFYFKYAGMVFNFLNHAEKIVDNITVSFMLFDSKTNGSPFISTNKFQITRWDQVFPDENKEIILSLDRFIVIAPTEPYLVDFFYIYEIHYVDGSVWRDEYGKYRVRN